MPGRPRSRPHRTGATTPSLKFSASDSTAPRATPWASRDSGSRPTMWATALRPASTPSRSSARATSATWRYRLFWAISTETSRASTQNPTGHPLRPALISAASTPKEATTATVEMAPAVRRPARPKAGRFNRPSQNASTRPTTTVGCGTTRYSQRGSPMKASNTIAASKRDAVSERFTSVRRRKTPG